MSPSHMKSGHAHKHHISSSMKKMTIDMVEIAKVCLVHCSTSRLALGSPGCLFVRRRRRHYAQNTTL